MKSPAQFHQQMTAEVQFTHLTLTHTYIHTASSVKLTLIHKPAVRVPAIHI